jgi:hypothetical protein
MLLVHTGRCTCISDAHLCMDVIYWKYKSPVKVWMQKYLLDVYTEIDQILF